MANGLFAAISRYATSMEKDVLQRRLRYAKPQARGQGLAVHAADMAVFEALHRHGPLPSHYLHEFARHLSRNRNAFQHRLTKLYNGSGPCGPLLARPAQQFASFNARYQHLIYDLTRTSRALLAERDTYYAPERTDPFVHRFMGACVGGSIELAGRARGIRYIAKDEIFAHPRCPESTRLSSNPLAIGAGNKSLVPDDLFGLQYPDKTYRFFVVEIDRNTESIERRNLSQASYRKKLDAYIEILGRGTFRERWGIPNLLVLTVTTNATHLRNLIDHLSKLTSGKVLERFLFKAKPEFGVNWGVPSVMDDLLAEPWARVGTPFDISRP